MGGNEIKFAKALNAIQKNHHVLVERHKTLGIEHTALDRRVKTNHSTLDTKIDTKIRETQQGLANVKGECDKVNAAQTKLVQQQHMEVSAHIKEVHAEAMNNINDLAGKHNAVVDEATIMAHDI